MPTVLVLAALDDGTPTRPTLELLTLARRVGEPVAVVLTPPDPDRPKRAGWWSKAKSVLSGS